MFQCLTQKRRKKQGFTLMEVMVVVGIIAVIAAIAIPSVISMQKNMDYRQQCDYAKTIFLAAQSNLADLRSTGELEQVEVSTGTCKVTLQSGDISGTAEGNLPDRFAERYLYAANPASGTDSRYDAVLPVNSVEALIRDQNVIIEYNPRTGSVYAVFYSEENSGIVEDYQHGRLQRDEQWLKNNKVGYYNGSDLSSEELGFYEAAPMLDYEDGQEGILTIVIPTQSTKSGVDVFFDSSKYGYYVKGLEIELTVIGENSGMFTKTIKEAGKEAGKNVVMGNPYTDGSGAIVIPLSFTLDSLLESSGFVNITENQKTVQGAVAGFHVLPGDNISLSAEISFAAGKDDPVIIFDDAVLAGVNPLFHSLTGDSVNGYTLAVSNGRHLQNLNAMDPGIADKVDKITFVQAPVEKEEEVTAEAAVPEINWKDTVDYYQAKTGNLDCFAPINNRYLAGTEVDGNNVIIRNLKIKASGARDINDYYADAFAEVNADVGLFRFINGAVHDLRVVNPVIRGGSASNAVGALAGSAGANAVVTNCYVYVDTDSEDFSWSYLDVTDGFDGSNELEYGVSGSDAVGGLVGMSDGAKFQASLAAVPVYGVMEGYGNKLGIGGFVGVADGGSFYKCYSSVRTLGTGAYSKDRDTSCGIGGFVGTSSDAKYTSCFASANVTSDASSDVTLMACGGFVGVAVDNVEANGALYNSCYALGTVHSTAGTGVKQAKFVGTNFSSSDVVKGCEDRYRQALSGKNSGYVYDGCYYLQGYNGVENDVDTCTLPAGYNLLHDVYFIEFVEPFDNYLMSSLGKTYFSDAERGKLMTALAGSDYKADWTSGLSSEKNGHYPYMQGYKENGANYPYSMLTNMPFYGTWPDAPSSVGIGYWEMYEDGKFGIYYDQVGDTTLQNKVVVADGYLILSANDPGTPEVSFGESGNTRVIDFVGPVSVGGNSYYYGIIPADVAVSGSFYTKVQMNDKIKTYTMYFNPNTAATQVNPAGMNADAKNPGTAAPDTLYIRTARQLAAIGSNAMSPYWGADYVIHGDIDFNKYGIDAGDLSNHGIDAEAFAKYGVTAQTMTSIGNAASFSGTLTGISGTTITVNNAASGLIGTLNGGTVSGITLNGSMTLGNGEGALVNTMNGGTLENCTVNAVITPEQGSTSAGLVVGALKDGTIANCHSNGTNASLGFVGDAVRSNGVYGGDATHYGDVLLVDGLHSTADISKLTEITSENKDNIIQQKYAAVIEEGCTYKINGKSEPVDAVTYNRYFYKVSGEDAYRAASAPATEFVAQSGIKLSRFGLAASDWKNTGYYFPIMGRYLPVFVKVEVEQPVALAEADGTEGDGTEIPEGSETTDPSDTTDSSDATDPPATEAPKAVYTYTFGCEGLGGSYTTLSTPKETTEPEGYVINDISLYSLSEPTVGNTYILKDSNGNVLKADKSVVSIPETGISVDMVWTVGQDGVWASGENEINVALNITSAGASQYPMVTVGEAQYEVYAVSMSSDRDVEMLDKDSVYSTTVPQTTES